ncbi:hypothetical protein V5O48_011531 [Marasmius crinis-equi]|uniref:Uncharacterized protein n=1 Tax=Marasmius crinis-equi TaxID=585013 RepID=A0ABR3F599_9AGAR
MPKHYTKSDDERLLKLLENDWISKTTIGSYRVHCRGCGTHIALDKRSGRFYANNWDKHEKSCRVIRKAKGGHEREYKDEEEYGPLTNEDLKTDGTDEKDQVGVFSSVARAWYRDNRGFVHDPRKLAPNASRAQSIANSTTSTVVGSVREEPKVNAVQSLKEKENEVVCFMEALACARRNSTLKY